MNYGIFLDAEQRLTTVWVPVWPPDCVLEDKTSAGVAQMPVLSLHPTSFKGIANNIPRLYIDESKTLIKLCPNLNLMA